MSLAVHDFWKLVVESQLLTDHQCRQLDAQAQGAGVAVSGVQPLADWLVKGNILSRYQAAILLRGRPGPFVYGDYRVYDRIAKGRLKGWFRAAHGPSAHPVTLQFLTGEQTSSTTWTAIQRQVAALSSLQSPRLARVYEARDLGSYKFVVHEDFIGQTVDETLRSAGPLPPSEACRMLRQVADGLQVMASHGLSHGDVRPQNIWISPTGAAKLLLDPTQRITPFQAGGDDPLNNERADYSAPEFTTATALADVYAAGCTLYTFLTGRPPFAGGGAADKRRRHATEAIQPLEPFGIPADVAEIVLYSMAKNPQVRYASPTVLYGKLATIAESEPPGALPAPASLAKYLTHQNEQRPPAPVTPAAPAMPQPALPTIETSPRIQIPPIDRPQVAAHAAAIQAPAIQTNPHPPEPITPSLTPPAPVPAAPLPDAPSHPPADNPLAAAPQIQTDASSAIPAVGPSGSGTSSRFRARRSRKNQSMILVAAGVVIIAATFGAWAILNRPNGAPTVAEGDGKPDPRNPDVVPNGADDPDVQTPATAAAPLLEDDGHRLWAPPFDAEPVALDFVPQGAECFAIIRPAALMEAPQGAELLQSLGPQLQRSIERFEEDAGIPWKEVDQLIVSFHDNDQSFPRVAMVVHLRQAIEAQTLQEQWGNPAAAEFESKTYYNGDSWSYFIPPENATVFVMASEPEIQEVIRVDGAPPVLRTELTRLLQTSHQQAHFTALFAPHYLFSEMFHDGRTFYFGSPNRLREALQSMLEDGLKGGMFELQMDETAYLALHLYGPTDGDVRGLMTRTRERLRQLPDQVEEYFLRLPIVDYWRRLSQRYPGMVRFVDRYTREGVIGNTAVLNAYLPGHAPVNLALGGEMLLMTPRGDAPATAGTTAPPTMEALLAAPLTMSFDQMPLDLALNDLTTAVTDEYPSLKFPFDIKIIGGDLELNGITQNQQIVDFSYIDRPLSDVLTGMVMKANPIKTVQKPSETDQMLLWVVGPDPEDPNRQIVLITTRDGAGKKGYQLPPAFRSEQ